MEDNLINASAESVFSLKRIEYLLEEMIFQQILSREPDLEKAKEKLNLAFGNVASSVKKYVEALQPPPDKSGNISVQ